MHKHQSIRDDATDKRAPLKGRFTAGARRLTVRLTKQRSIFAEYALKGAAYKAGTMVIALLATWWESWR
ncbi:hypothetical protein [Actinacidiphila oryziradicis]|uniref:Uncharacterized protein n=1 Tax=Actinacidiphila oryziradicis TaxID=2571141 RepID=A0A4U0RSC6_9ACTN|nr:hypothetical protein [Actinacidiphila oryziradicis]TJZ99003.1 hypothetical protein FCI23_47410 [Actinacidiphila oryziradicis]